MANTLYDIARQMMLTKQGAPTFTWDSVGQTADDIYMIFVDGDYTPAFTGTGGVQYLNAIATTSRHNSGAPEANNEGVQLQVTSVTDDGAADAEDTTMTAVLPFGTNNTGEIKAIVLYARKGADETQNPLIAYIDVATGLPIRPNGGDIIVSWDPGVNKIFRP
mgnify:CR=1 FL=1